MVAVCILRLSLCLLPAYKEVAEFNALCNLADSLPNSNSEEEDLAMETDPRYLISHSLMKALLDTRAVEDEATVEEESNVLEGDDSGGNDGLVVNPFFTEDEGSLKHSLNLDGHVEFCSEDEEEDAADTEVGLAVTEHEEEEEVLQVEGEHEDGRVEQGEEVAGAAPTQEVTFVPVKMRSILTAWMIPPEVRWATLMTRGTGAVTMRVRTRRLSMSAAAVRLAPVAPRNQILLTPVTPLQSLIVTKKMRDMEVVRTAQSLSRRGR